MVSVLSYGWEDNFSIGKNLENLKGLLAKIGCKKYRVEIKSGCPVGDCKIYSFFLADNKGRIAGSDNRYHTYDSDDDPCIDGVLIRNGEK